MAPGKDTTSKTKDNVVGPRTSSLLGKHGDRWRDIVGAIRMNYEELPLNEELQQVRPTLEMVYFKIVYLRLNENK